MFGCLHCGVLVVLCLRCFHGQRYCADCQEPAWVASRARARRTYAASPEGRLGNADRQRDHRQRVRERRAVTDQGSTAVPVGTTVSGSSGDPPDVEVPDVPEVDVVPDAPLLQEGETQAPAVGEVRVEPRVRVARSLACPPSPDVCCDRCGRRIDFLLRHGARRPAPGPAG